ncbi:MAG: hypothetical protein COA79_05155 [Planctomycetota bacterium]|nr:MAG: hypothetical protein COA79_05155 [Planctomycetota bacterium]
MAESIADALIKPTLSLVCPYCQKFHKIPNNITVETTECNKCSKKIRLPKNLSEMEEQLNNFNQFGSLKEENRKLLQVVLDQEDEIKQIKEKANFVGILPQNAKRTLGIIDELKETLVSFEDDLNNLSKINLVDLDNSESSSSDDIKDET